MSQLMTRTILAYDTSMDASTDVVTMPSLLDLSPPSNDSNACDEMFLPSKAPSSLFLCGMSLCFTGGDSMVLLNDVIFHMLVGVYHIVMNDLIP